MINCADELSYLLRYEAEGIEITRSLYLYYLNEASQNELGKVKDQVEHKDLWIADFKFYDVFGDAMLFLEFGNDYYCRLLSTVYRMQKLNACFEIGRETVYSKLEISYIYNEDYCDEVVEQFYDLYGRQFETVNEVINEIEGRKHLSIPELEEIYGVCITN